MHPHVVQDNQGDCPICGMRLVLVEQEEEPEPPASKPSTDTPAVVSSAGPKQVEGYAHIRVPGSRRQLIGVRMARVESAVMERELRTVAVVEQDETRVHHVHSKVTGWVERLQVDYQGQPVEKGQALFDIYSPDLVATQEEFLIALRNFDKLKSSPFPDVAENAKRLVEATRRRLRLWDVPEQALRRLEETRKVQRTLTFFSPMSGYVVHKWVEHGMFVDPGKMLFTIADLSTVWVIADVYEYELSLVHEGQEASLDVAAYPGEEFLGQVDYVYPTMDRQSRTAKVRFRFPNPDFKLKPGMYSTVHLEINLGTRLVVPEEAILDTGSRQIVFVDAGEGWFVPREIQTGMKASGTREVLGGLQEGESVVTSGNFMIDSESRLKASIDAASDSLSHEGH